MSGALEQAIQEAVSNDRLEPLTGLTLWPSGSRWQANARFAGSSGWVVVLHDDPVLALLGALGARTSEVSHSSPVLGATGVFD